MTELLKCPFCGKKPSLGKGRQYGAGRTYMNRKKHDWVWRPFIKCRTCVFERVFESVEQAAAWWNKRATPRPITQDSFVDMLLAELLKRGIDTTKWDGDEPPHIIIANGITAELEARRRVGSKRTKRKNKE
jgi:hypothetical protein